MDNAVIAKSYDPTLVELSKQCLRLGIQFMLKSYVLSLIGVRAGKFLGVQRYFARIYPNLPENLLCDKLSPHNFFL